MFDINAIISAALNAAVTTAITPLLERIDNLDAVCQAQAERIAALETKLTEAALFTQTSNVTIPIDEAKMVEALNSQEWFWEKLQNRIDAATEEAMDEHTSTYDHDDYDSHVSDDDKHFEGNIEDALNRVLRNASIEIRV